MGVADDISGLLAKVNANPTLADVDRLLDICRAHRDTYGNLIDKCLDIRLLLMNRDA
jgi:hypothetical protein